MSVAPPKPPRLATALAVAVALLFPTAMASVYFLALGGTGRHNLLQQIAYGAGKRTAGA